MSKVKSILFRAKLNGKGVVNFDGNQKQIWNKQIGIEKDWNDNNSFAKKNWYVDENNELTYKLKISSNCLKHEIFKDSFMFQSPNVMMHDELLLMAIASPASLLRGYLFATKEQQLKRSSPITITDAEQISNSKSTLELFTRSGEKNIDENKSDISLFKKETVGEITYALLGAIDLMQLQFLSCDQVFDRFGLNPDNFKLWKDLLSSKLDNSECELGYYQINGSDIQIPEYGIKFSNEMTNELIKDYFKRLLNLNILKSSAYANIQDVEYKLIYNPITDRLNDENGWVSLTDISQLPNIDIYNYYILEDATKSKLLREKLIELRNKNKEDNKKAKLDEANKKASAKANKIDKTSNDSNSEE